MLTTFSSVSRINQILRVPHAHIVGTRQNIGKSTISHGLFNDLRQGDLNNVGYIKPVATSSYDHKVFHREYGLTDSIDDLNPVRIGRKTTTNYIMGNKPEREQIKIDTKLKILDAFGRIAQDKDFVIVEGTGHSAVGYCLDLSNAVVANLLNSPVILLVEGGIGKTVDLSALHLEYFRQKGCQILGVIINRVEPGTWKKIGPPLERNFSRLGINILGYVYFNSILASATAREIGDAIEDRLNCEEFKESALINKGFLGETITQPILGTMKLSEIRSSFMQDGAVAIVPSHKIQLITRIASLKQDKTVKQPASMIIVGNENIAMPPLEKILNDAPFPIWRIPHGKIENVYTLVDHVIHEGNHKIDADDRNKLSIIHGMVAEHVDVDKIAKEAEKSAGSLRWLLPNISRYFLFNKALQNADAESSSI